MRRGPHHQDAPELGSDQVGEVQFWIALDEVTPEMGAMRFLDGSHREGILGVPFSDEAGLAWGELPDLLDRFPKLTDLYELSPALHYQPGDANVHHPQMVHGAPPNTTDRRRLS